MKNAKFLGVRHTWLTTIRYDIRV